MKVRLSHNEFFCLYMLLQHVVMQPTPVKGFQAIVLHGVIFSLYRKFHSRSIVIRTTYTMTMEPAEASAFYLFFTKFDMTQLDAFTVNLVNQLCNAAHQKYSA